MSTFSLDVEEVEEAIQIPFVGWGGNCHGVSLAIVQAGLVPGGRVMRGGAERVWSQHSWIVVGEPLVGTSHMAHINWGMPIIDPTLCFYHDDVEGIWTGALTEDGIHQPKGAGSIWEYGQPVNQGGEPIHLDGLSEEAQVFLDLCNDKGLDRHGWSILLHSPVEGWPSSEIITAASRDPRLSPIIPIDMVGNWTDENPDGLYR